MSEIAAEAFLSWQWGGNIKPEVAQCDLESFRNFRDEFYRKVMYFKPSKDFSINYVLNNFKFQLYDSRLFAFNNLISR